MMKIILAQNLTYVPALTGASKGNRLLIEQLAQRGHVCKVVGLATLGQSQQAQARYRAALEEQAIAVGRSRVGADCFTLRGVEVHAAMTQAQLRESLRSEIATFDPTWVIVSSEDMDQSLLRTALEGAPGRVVFIARTTPMLPFGPASFDPSPKRALLFQQLAGVMTISEHVRSYIRRWSGLDAVVMRLPVYGAGPFPQLGSFDRGYLTFINPCAYKGIAIFLGLARHFPQLPFAAIPTWGTTQADLAALRALPNVDVLEPVEDIHGVFRQTRALLMPSLWDEAFGRTSVEAMLTGVPVLASDVGGLPEAKLGVDYVLPVRGVERYEERLDDRLSPVPVIPEQDLTPWVAAIEELLGDRARYERLSAMSREAAHAYVGSLSFDLLEQYLLSLVPAQVVAAPVVPDDGGSGASRQVDLDSLTPQQRALLMLRLRKKGVVAPRQGIVRRSGEGALPLSFAQQRLWFLDQLVTGSSFYSMPSAVRMRGALDLGALRRGLGALTQRHETLRTIFPTVGGEPLQQILPMVRVPLSLVDLQVFPAGLREGVLGQVVGEVTQQPFRLAEGPLVRAVLVRLGVDDHVLVVVLHHIISDGWSTGVLVQELVLFYNAFVRGGSVPLPELPIQYADFAVWQRQWLEGARLEEQVAYWRQQLADLPVFQMPTDFPRPNVQHFRAARCHFRVGRELMVRLGEVGRQEGTTLFMTMLAAFQVLLARYAGQLDVVVGTPIAGRTRTELEGLIGCFVNMLVVRTRLTRMATFREVLRQVRDVTTGAYAHQDVPFEKLVEELHPVRDLGRHPLFQILFQLHQGSGARQSLAGLTVERLVLDAGRSNFDLALVLVEFPDSLEGRFEYAVELFRAETIGCMVDHFLVLLQAVVDGPEQPVGLLPLLTAAEYGLLTRGWSQPLVPVPSVVCLQGLFEEQVRRCPDRVALVAGGQALSYAALGALADGLAVRLRAAGVGAEALVGVCMERGLMMVVGLLGVLKVGGAYVPLDVDYPDERLALMLAETQATVVLTQRGLVSRFQGQRVQLMCLDGDWGAGVEGEVQDAPVGGEQLAYVIYTSGSTGRPKGVAITHRSAVALMYWARQVFSDSELSGVLASTSICFDLSVFELFVPLSWGGCVFLVDSALGLLGVAGDGVRLVNTVPSAIAELLRLDGLPLSVETVNLAGEPLPQQLVTQLYGRAHVQRVWNLYGPSEDTTYSTAGLMVHGDEVPSIGQPIAGTQAYVLDAALQFVPIGVPGELYLGGVGLARGYLERPDLTAERFVPDAFGEVPGGRLYRTGDVARYRRDGQLDYLGRVDHQVKVRGFRIELDEVAARLGEHPDVQQAVVVVREYAGDRQLVAYVVPSDVALGRGRSDVQVWADEVRCWLQARLPRFMIPAAVVFLAAFPLTRNGKLDRAALPAPVSVRAPVRGLGQRTPVEELIASLWAAVLQVDEVGVDEDFFALGGHSLLATQVVARMRAAFQVVVPLQVMFEYPTVAGLARWVMGEAQAAVSDDQVPLVPVPRDRPLLAAFAQERLWQIQQQDPATTRYNIPIVLRLQGGLDRVALGWGIRDLVRRHEVLRTTFVVRDGELFQVIAADSMTVLVVRDVQGLPADEREGAANECVRAELARPFDLAAEPLVRAMLVQVAEQVAVLVLSMHHIVSDGWSLGIMARDVIALYAGYRAGAPVVLPELPIQFADFACWQRQWLQGAVRDRLVGYWQGHLAGARPWLRLPIDQARPSVQTYQGRMEGVRLSGGLTDQLRRLGRQEGATLFMSLLAGFYVLLYSYSGETDVVIGTSIAHRRRAEVEHVVGLFFHLLPLRARFEPQMSFVELLRHVREVTLGAYAHQDLPFKVLREHLALPESPNYAPFLQVQLVLQNLPMPDLQMPGVSMEPLVFDPGTAKSDLILSLREDAGCLRGAMEYNSDLFSAATIVSLLGRFQAILEHAVGNPGGSLAALCAGCGVQVAIVAGDD